MLTSFFGAQNKTTASTPATKNLTYRFENASGMNFTIVQSDPENPITSRRVAVSSDWTSHEISSRLSSEGNISLLQTVQSECNWVLRIRVYLQKSGSSTKTLLGGLNVDDANYGKNTLSGTTKVNYGDTVIYEITQNVGVMTSSAVSGKFPEGDVDNPWTIGIENLYNTNYVGATLSYRQPYVYSLNLSGKNTTSITLENCNALIDIYQNYKGRVASVNCTHSVAKNIGSYILKVGSHSTSFSLFMQYVTEASVTPPTPSKEPISFTVGVTAHPGMNDVSINVWNKAKTKRLATVTFESSDLETGASQVLSNIPNEDNGLYFLEITGDYTRSEEFRFYDGGTFLF